LNPFAKLDVVVLALAFAVMFGVAGVLLWLAFGADRIGGYLRSLAWPDSRKAAATPIAPTPIHAIIAGVNRTLRGAIADLQGAGAVGRPFVPAAHAYSEQMREATRLDAAWRKRPWIATSERNERCGDTDWIEYVDLSEFPQKGP